MTKALAFDLFGTVFDWRNSIVWAGKALSLPDTIDWNRVAECWARRYVELVQGPWESLGPFFEAVGDVLLAEEGCDSFISRRARRQFNTIWENLEIWDDVEGFFDVRGDRPYRLIALSNANTDLVEQLSMNQKLHFDAIYGSERHKLWKPDLRVYKGLCDLYRLEPSEVVMVAAHLFDLKAAKEAGFKTIFVPRPGEETGSPEVDYVDAVVDGFHDLYRAVRRLDGQETDLDRRSSLLDLLRRTEFTWNEKIALAAAMKELAVCCREDIIGALKKSGGFYLDHRGALVDLSDKLEAINKAAEISGMSLRALDRKKILEELQG